MKKAKITSDDNFVVEVILDENGCGNINRIRSNKKLDILLPKTNVPLKIRNSIFEDVLSLDGIWKEVIFFRCILNGHVLIKNEKCGTVLMDEFTVNNFKGKIVRIPNEKEPVPEKSEETD